MIEDGEGITHAAVGLLGDDVERLGFGLDALFLGHVLQVADDVGDGDAGEVVDLTAGEDRGEDLVLLRGGEDEDGVVWRLLEGLEEGVEGGLAEHVHLVDDIDLVSPHLRRNAHLLDERADVVDGVVRGRVELVDVERALLVERSTRFARVAGLALGGEVHAIDGLGEDACAGRLADAAWAAEEVGVSQFIVLDRVLERCGQCGLPHDAVECSGAILARRYDVFIRLFHCGAKVGE